MTDANPTTAAAETTTPAAVSRETTPETAETNPVGGGSKAFTIEDLDDSANLHEFLKGRTFKAKINGQEKDAPWEDVWKRYQMEEAADAKFKRAAEVQKATAVEKQELEEWKADPWGYLKRRGQDPEELAERILMNKIQFEQMSPEQKSLVQAQQREIEYQKEIGRYKKEIETGQFQAVEAKVTADIDSEISVAIDKSGLAPSADLVKLVATLMLSHAEGGGRLSAANACEAVKGMASAYAKTMLGSMPVEELQKILPRNLRDGLRKEDVKAALAQDPVKRSRNPDAAPRPSVIRRPISTDEAFAKLEQRFIKSRG